MNINFTNSHPAQKRTVTASPYAERQPLDSWSSWSYPEAISSYDVLLEEKIDRLQFAPQGAVGNERFLVFLNVNKRAFIEAKKNQDDEESQRIALTIVKTICHECIPNGRFLMKSRKDQEWIDLGDGTLAKNRVLEVFHTLLSGESLHAYPQKDLVVPRFEPSTNSASKKRAVVDLTDTRFSVDSVLEKNTTLYGKACQGNKRQKCTYTSRSSKSKSEKLDELMGYLRSVPKDELSPPQHERNQHKPTPSNALIQGIHPSEINCNDVLCGGSGQGILDKQTIGNNRFRVIVNMHREKYSEADRKGKFSIVRDIVKTVKSREPRGRFLVENPETCLWQELKVEKAWAKTVRTISSKKKTLKTTEIQLPNSDVNVLRSAALQALARRRTKKKCTSSLALDQIKELHEHMKFRVASTVTEPAASHNKAA